MSSHTNADGRRSHKGLMVLSGLHFINDLHASFLPTFLPLLIRNLSLTLGEAGTLNALFGGIHLIAQPLAGLWADRSARSLLVFWGPVLTLWGACLIPLAPTLPLAFLIVGIFSLGTAAFHPQGHGLVGAVVPGNELGGALAIFAAAGTLGAALSPLYAVALWDTPGHLGLVGVSAGALLIPLLCRGIFPRRTPGAGSQLPPFKQFLHVGRLVAPILALTIARDATSQGIRVFLPLWVTLRGGTLAQGGTLLFAYTLGGMAGGMLAGRLSDRLGTRPFLTGSFALAPALLLGGLVTQGGLSWLLLVLGGAVLSSSSPVTTALAQKTTPESRSTASSLAMGVSWGLANWVTSPLGLLADAWGLNQALICIALTPWAFLALNPLVSRVSRGAPR